MSSSILDQLLEQYPFHFVLQTQNTRILDRLHQMSMHDDMLEVSPHEYLIFFSDDRSMNACLKKVEVLLKDLEPSLAFF